MLAPKTGFRVRRRSSLWLLTCSACAGLWLCLATARAQPLGFSAESWGQSYRPAGLLSLEARAHAYPWIRAETQVWAGQSSLPQGSGGNVVVLSVQLREPTEHFEAHAGRFVLSTGAVRPVHIDGGYARGQTHGGLALEGFAGVPVSTRFTGRDYDWLAGARLSQRVFEFAKIGASYVERRNHGSTADREVGADWVIYPARDAALSGRFSWDLISRGMSELNVTSSLGGVERRIELFGNVRNPSLILPATSLFSVLSNAPSVQVGTSGRVRVAPRLRLEGIGAYRSYDHRHGARVRMGGTLWLDDEGTSAIEAALTRDGVRGQRWTGARVLCYRDLIRDLRLLAELELVLPDAHAQGRVWPWGRLSSRYTVREAWQLSAGVEGSASPQFTRVVQALVQVTYTLSRGPS